MQSPSDVSAADALLSLSCRHNNLADSSSKIDLPSVARSYQRRDQRQDLKILSEGILPSIKWGVVKSDFQLSLSQFFHRSLQVSFIFVPTIGDVTLVNVDTKMIEDSTNAVVVHGTHLVYVAVLSETLCREVHLLGCVLSFLSMSLKESKLRGRTIRSCRGHQILPILE